MECGVRSRYFSSSVAVARSRTRRLKTLRLGLLSRALRAAAWARAQRPHCRAIRITSLSGFSARSTRSFSAKTIRRLHVHLAAAVDAEGRPDVVLRAFALHLQEYLLAPSGRGGAHTRKQALFGFAGCFTYQPPRGVVWEVQSLDCGGQSLEASVRGSKFKPACPPAAAGYLSRFLCVGFALALLATGCAGPRPLQGGKAVTTRKPAGVVEQTLVQGENPSQASKQTQESVKVRTYTLPAGSRMEQSQPPDA